MIILNEEDDPAQLNDKAQWIKFTIKNFRMNDINKEILCKKKKGKDFDESNERENKRTQWKCDWKKKPWQILNE